MSTPGDTGNEPLILELLQKAGILDPKNLGKVFELQNKHRESLELALVRSGQVDEGRIAQEYADYLMLPLWQPENQARALESLAGAAVLPEKLCRENLIAPVERLESALRVAAVNPTDLTLFEELQMNAGMRIEVCVARITVIQSALDALYGARDVARELSAEVDQQEKGAAEIETEETLLDLTKAVPNTREGQIVSLVNHVLEQAVRRKASDIHLEPYEDCVRTRLRIDGNLVELTPPPRSMFVPMVSRLKILSRMDIAEKRIPQDGAFSIQLEGDKIDLRVSTVPSVWGEKMVMRLLNKKAIPLKLSMFGLNEKQSRDFETAIQSPHGLIFVTGPTGSGKSTTLYTALNMLNTADVNLVTVEDPVEYRFTGINQIQVKPQVGLTFASALRAFLRQDPDIIMVGEVRDQETAEICMRAALTGHLVLSTLHTNAALAAINRLTDMGIEPFLLSATLRMVQAQRLIRKLCPECKKPIKVDPGTCRSLNLDPEETLYGPAGCAACGDTGYRGRLGIFEIIPIGAALRSLIQTRAGWKELCAAAKQDGVEFLCDSGVQKARAGLTSIEEVLTVALAGED